ncbi:MAG: DUF2617 family protein [bacterium]
MSMLNTIDQSMRFIRHYLIEGPLDMEQFTVFQDGSLRIRQHNLELTGRIIGESNIFSFQLDDFVFHEILACTDVNLKSLAQIRASYGPLDEGVTQDISVTLCAKVNYRFGAQVLKLVDARKWLGSFEDRALSFASQDKTIALVHTFSYDKEQQLTDVPKTIVLGQYLPAFHEIRITTAHSYPNEQKVVRSDSVIQLL